MREALRLVTGPLPALEERLAQELADAQSGDPLTPTGVLVGGTLLRPYLQRRLGELGGGIVNVRFLLASELALALGERGQVRAGRQPLPPLGDRVLLRDIAFDHDGYFGPVRDTPGFAEALHRLARELRAAGYDATSFRSSVAGTCEVASKEDSLSTLFEQFLVRRQDFYGPDDCLLSAEKSDLPVATLAVYGLWELPFALRRTLEDLATSIPVTIYLPRTGSLADEVHADLRSWMEQGGFEEEGLTEASTAVSGNGHPSALDHLQQSLFDSRARQGPLDGTVRLLSAPNPSREVREAARTCLTWAHAGIRFHEMALIYRHADTYRPVVESVFREAGVPVYLHEGTPLVERPVGRRTKALLDLVTSGLDRRAVMDFLTDTRLPEETREAYGGAPAARWDKLSREAGIVSGADQWRERLVLHREELLGGADPKEAPEQVRHQVSRLDDLRRFIFDLAGALADHRATGSWSEHLRALERLITRYVHGSEAVMDALSNLERFDALTPKVSFVRFAEVVQGALETLRSEDVLGEHQGAFARRGVNVLDANSIRHVRFRAVVILGLSERVFPPPPRQDSLLLDHERTALNERGEREIPLRARGADPEPLQFAMAVHAAQERLLLTYPRKSAGEARPQLPSMFFRAAAEAMVGDRVRASEVDRLPSELYERMSGSRIGAADLSSALSGPERDRTLVESSRALGREVLAASEARVERSLAGRAARFRPRLTEHDGALTEETRSYLERVLDPQKPLSPTGLETYATCPQRFFLERLRAKPVDEPEATVRISALDKGNLVHRILERFLAEAPTAGNALLHGASEPERLERIVDEECDRAEARGETGYGLMWRYDRRELREDMLAWLDHERRDPAAGRMPNSAFETRFGPRWFEQPEGELSSDEPLKIRADGVVLQVAGRIDRIDWDPDQEHFRVVDYKTGKVKSDHVDDAFRGGRALQLPLYLFAAARLVGMRPEAGVAQYHFPTRRGEFARRVFTGSTLERRRAEFDRLIAGLVDAIRSGAFHMQPVEEQTCRWCDFDGLCPTARWRQIERKQGDDRARQISELRETE